MPEAPQIGNRDGILVVILRDVGASGSPRAHATSEVGLDEGLRRLVVRKSKGAVIERATRLPDDELFTLDVRMADRACHPNLRRAVRIGEEDGAGIAAIGRGLYAYAGSDL